MFICICRKHTHWAWCIVGYVVLFLLCRIFRKHNSCCRRGRRRLLVCTAVTVPVGLKAEDQIFFDCSKHTANTLVSRFSLFTRRRVWSSPPPCPVVGLVLLNSFPFLTDPNMIVLRPVVVNTYGTKDILPSAFRTDTKRKSFLRIAHN